jgi:SAM-dependent methyltransferase
LDPERLRVANLTDLQWQADVVLASEVLEHIVDDDQAEIFVAIERVLKPDGRLLVTVPNGYGWFEFESFAYFKLKLGRVLEVLRVAQMVHWVKSLILRTSEDSTPSTLADSPHVQWFTRRSIRQLLRRYGYRIDSEEQTVLFCGPFSNMFATGVGPVMRLNCKLGDLFPSLASGFMFACRRESTAQQEAST